MGPRPPIFIMGALAKFFDWLFKLLALLSSPLGFLSLTISTLFASLATAIGTLVTKFNAIMPQFEVILQHMVDYGASFRTAISETELWGFLYHLFALDSLAEALSYFVAFYSAVGILTAVGVFFTFFSVVVSFLTLKVSRLAISTLSSGFLKP